MSVAALLKRKSVRLVLAAALAYAATVATTGKFDPSELIARVVAAFAAAPQESAPDLTTPDAGA